MPEEIHQIVYSSKATRPMRQEELASILDVARRNNTANGITGMLLFRGGHFLQVLEGPEEQMRALLDKLNRDNRHRGVRVLLHGRIAARAFGTWSMAFQNLSGLDPGELPGYSQFLTKGFSSRECVRYPQKALQLVLAFRDTDLTKFEALTSRADKKRTGS